MINTDDLTIYREQAIKAAAELHYGWEVTKRIREATTCNQIQSIMRDARIKKCEEDEEKKR